MILAQARERATHMMDRARENLKAELAEMAMAEAERIIRTSINKEDQDRLISDYMSELATAAG